jgi:hypothetical protein
LQLLLLENDGISSTYYIHRQFTFFSPIHAALGGGWPRWQPLNAADAMFFWRDASRRGSWQAATATTAYSCDRTIAALVFSWGTAGSGNGRGAPVFNVDDGF